MNARLQTIFGTPDELVDLLARTFWTAVQAVFGLVFFDALSDIDLAWLDIAGGAALTSAATVVTVYARQRLGHRGPPEVAPEDATPGGL